MRFLFLAYTAHVYISISIYKLELSTSDLVDVMKCVCKNGDRSYLIDQRAGETGTVLMILPRDRKTVHANCEIAHAYHLAWTTGFLFHSINTVLTYYVECRRS